MFLIKKSGMPRFLLTEIEPGGMTVHWTEDLKEASKWKDFKGALDFMKRVQERYPREAMVIYDATSLYQVDGKYLGGLGEEVQGTEEVHQKSTETD